MAVDAQHIHHMWTRPTVDLNSPELTIFYRVLTAAHTPDSLEGAPPLPKHQLLVPARVPGLIRSSDMVKWERKQTSSAPDDDDSSDEENARITRRRVKGKKKPRDGEASTDVLATPLYTPFGEWAFAADHNMVNVKTLLVLGGKHIILVGVGEFLTICHSWSIKDSNQLSGFYQELALFKSSLHLRPLQGAVVPALVNVTRSALGASLNMVAPHPTFWMEASPDMPFVLKLHVIDAYTRLHAHGILHGNPQLRNMLICGDGRVKIVDFQSSRSLRPISIVGIHAANEADLELEMRQVRFKLDFGDARRYEEEKRQRARDIERRNNDRARLRKLVIRGLLHAQVDPDEGYTGNDQTHPPIPDAFWYDHWVDDVNRAPRRFVVPGKTQEEVTAALRHFESIVVKFQADYDQSWVDSGKRPGPSRSGRSPPEDDGLETILIGGSYVRRRRRSPTESSEVGGPTLTRPDTQEELARLIRETEAEAASATDWPFPSQVIGKTWNGRGVGVGDYGYDLPASSSPSSPPKAPIVRDYCTVGATRAPLLENPYRKKTRAKSEGISSGELPRASSTPSRPPKEVKAIDFVARPHNGVGGYYVRHAPTENRMSIERVRYIREQNRELAENMGFGPLYSTDDKYCLPPSFKRPPTDRPHWTSISIGTLKRRRECIIGREDYDDYPHVRKRAKTEGEEICDVRHIKTKDYVDVKADCSLVEPSQLGWRLASLGRASASRKLPDTREFWTGEREPCLSPKLGPPKLPISENEPRAILGSFVYEALPRFHMRQLTSEHRRLVAKQDKGNKESTPPPPTFSRLPMRH
ncbi:uncharacterized protein B0H18DRAFT_950418 [Fomitopsis serialis]|uniref:uncharacterized protein n=1 Tax=Fomitopsis serialis TaxID=139415 RepID=UPI002007207D|nr:uncharacterized protein B0H18DRAFT_950418 [Neoantrodia serialis]KAH9937629.1 hypothetical protein B0H18DRAFT_950418 [Neoantrodia serialis]